MADSEITRTDDHERKIGTCPACGLGIWGNLTTVVTTRAPHWIDGKPTVSAGIDIVAMTVSHECDSRSEEA